MRGRSNGGHAGVISQGKDVQPFSRHYSILLGGIAIAWVARKICALGMIDIEVTGEELPLLDHVTSASHLWLVYRNIEIRLLAEVADVYATPT